MASSKVDHFDEVAEHNVVKDCWLLVDGKVYDVAPFIEDHPGGDERFCLHQLERMPPMILKI